MLGLVGRVGVSGSWRLCHAVGMCVQCMMGAMTAGAGASGARSWLATRRWAWLTAARLRRATIALLLAALAASATLIGGSTPTGTATASSALTAHAPANHSPQRPLAGHT